MPMKPIFLASGLLFPIIGCLFYGNPNFYGETTDYLIIDTNNNKESNSK